MKNHVNKIMEEIKIKNLYNLEETISRPLLERFNYPWESLKSISEFIIEIGKTLNPKVYELKGENIWIAKSAKIMNSAFIGGPAIIGENTEVRHCAFIRESAIIGNNCVIRKLY